MANLERIYTIPLADAFEYIRTKRCRRAVKIVRAFALRHMKAEEAKISEGVNSLIFRDGMQKPPRRLKVRIVKDEEGTAKVWLIGEQESIAALAEKKKQEDEAKKKAQEAAKKEKEPKKAESKQEGAAKPSEGKKPDAKPSEAKKPEAKAAASPLSKPEAKK